MTCHSAYYDTAWSALMIERIERTERTERIEQCVWLNTVTVFIAWGKLCVHGGMLVRLRQCAQ
jgi:hypothetical protein